MITIRNSVLNIDAILKEHSDFVLPRLNKITDFYIDLFEYLAVSESNRRINNASFLKEVDDIVGRNKITNFNRLLNTLLVKKIIEDRANFGNIRSGLKRVPAAKSVSFLIPSLKSLKRDLPRIVNYDLTVESNAALYKFAVRRYSAIAFLFPQIFDYENWFSTLEPDATWGPYQLTAALKLNTCPYCNRQYTFTVMDIRGKKIARPELDHFLPKQRHPMLAVSFFNLIPSCTICNGSIKGSQDVHHNTHLSPYAHNPDHAAMRFTYYPKSYAAAIGLTEDLSIEVQYSGNPSDGALKTKVEGSIELFCLNQVYQNHKDVVREIVRKRHISSDRYIQTIQSTFNGFSLTVEEAYLFAFGNHHKESSFYKRPLSKLTRDIAIELSMLKEYNPGT